MARRGPIQSEPFCGSVKGIIALQLIGAELQTEWWFNERVECYEKDKAYFTMKSSTSFPAFSSLELGLFSKEDQSVEHFFPKAEE